MTKTDLSLACALDRECYPDRPLSSTQWRKVLREVDGLSCWLFPDQKTYCVLQSAVEGGCPVVRLLRLGVGVGERRKGHGKALLGRIVWNCEAIVSERNLPALKLLCGCGFAVMGLIGADRDRVVLYRSAKDG